MITVKVESRGRHGEIVGLVETPAQSLVFNFLKLLEVQMAQRTSTAINIAGAWFSVSVRADNFTSTIGAEVVGRGIVVGTATDPVSPLQATLFGRIPHGTLADQLLYQEVTFVAPTATTNLVQFQMSRVFLNRSPVPATINEVGIYSVGYPGTVMIDRTVLPTPVTIPDGGQVTIVYTFRGTLG